MARIRQRHARRLHPGYPAAVARLHGRGRCLAGARAREELVRAGSQGGLHFVDLFEDYPLLAFGSYEGSLSIDDITPLPLPAEPSMKYSVVDQGDEVPLGTRSGVYVAPARGIVLVKAGKPTFLPVDDVRLLAAELGLIK